MGEIEREEQREKLNASKGDSPAGITTFGLSVIHPTGANPIKLHHVVWKRV